MTILRRKAPPPMVTGNSHGTRLGSGGAVIVSVFIIYRIPPPSQFRTIYVRQND